MRSAVIDIGSGTIRLLVGEQESQNIRMIESLQNPLPLGRSTFLKGGITQDMINQTINILKKYQEIISQYQVQETKIVATTAVREARNRDIFLDTIFRKTGLDIEVLNVGDVVFYIDSYLSYYLEKNYPVQERNLLIAELGGGSLDVSVMRKGFTLMNLGLSIGTVRLKQLLTQLDGSRQENAEILGEYIQNEFFYLKKNIPRIQIDDVVVIDENCLYLQNVFSEKKISTDLFQLTRQEILSALELLSQKSVQEISLEHKMPLDLAETMEAYLLVLSAFFNVVDKKYVYILRTSLSEAILASMLSDAEVAKRYNKQNQLVAAAVNLCHRYNLDLNHAKHVAGLSEKIFNTFKDHFGLKDADGLYLIIAAYLHDIGTFINNRAHHKHTEYIISGLNFFRLTEEEVKIIACIGRYHRRSTPQKTHPAYQSLSLENKILVQKLSAILRIANALDSSHKQKAKDIEIRLSPKGDAVFVAYAKENFSLEYINFEHKKTFFEDITGNKIRLIMKEQF